MQQKTAAAKKSQDKFEFETGRPIVLPELRVLQLFGDVSPETVAPVIACIHYINGVAPHGTHQAPIRLYVNSDGGAFEDGFALVDVIRSSAIPVETHCIGRACSVALPVFLAGHKRVMYKHAYVMFHGVSLNDLSGTSKNLRTTVNEADKSNKTMMDYITSRCKITPSMLKSHVDKNTDLYLYPEEVIKYKMADELL
jgi:ATP-dependent Clp protease protease subunit